MHASATTSPARTTPPPAPRRTVQYVVDRKVLAITLIACALLAPAVWAWWRFQLGRTATGLRDRGQALVKEGKPREAVGYYERYLEIRASDFEATVELAKIYDDVGKFYGKARVAEKKRAIELYNQAVGMAPEDRQSEFHAALARLYLDVGQMKFAELQAARLLQIEDTPAAWRLMALALLGEASAQIRPEAGALPRGTKRTLGAVFRRALEVNPGDELLAGYFAGIHRNRLAPAWLGEKWLGDKTAETKDWAQAADKIIDDMVAYNARHGKNPMAYLARYIYRTAYGLPGAEEDLKKALELGPERLDVLWAAADHHWKRFQQIGVLTEEAREELAAARKYYETAIRVAPNDIRPRILLARTYFAERDVKRAIRYWDAALDKFPGNPDLHTELCRILIADGNAERAAKELQWLQTFLDNAVALPPAEMRERWRAMLILRGSLLALQGQHVDARKILASVTGNTPASAPTAERAQAVDAWMLIGRIHAQLEQWDQAAVAMEEAFDLTPTLTEALLAAADAYLRADQPESAVKLYDRATNVAGGGELWLSLARGRFAVEMKKPASARDWRPLEIALEQAESLGKKKPLREPWRLEALKIEHQLAKEGGQAGPRIWEQLRDLEARNQTDPAALEALASTYQRTGKTADALRVLAALDKLAPAGRKPETGTLLRARALADQKDDQERYAKARKALEEGLAKWPEARAAIRLAIAQLYAEEGNLKAARETLAASYAAGDGRDAREKIGLVVQLAESAAEQLAKSTTDPKAESAARQKSIAELARWTAELKKPELGGADGPYTMFYEAQRLLLTAKGPKDPQLVEAGNLQKRIALLRPNWTPNLVLLAAIRERSEQFEEAVTAYKQAERAGDRRLIVYERLFLLLQRLDRAQEFADYEAKLTEEAPGSGLLERLRIDAAIRGGQMELAAQYARDRAEKFPNDWQAQLKLGQTLALTEKRAEAEQALRRAAALAPGEPAAVHALVAFYCQAKQLQAARDVLAAVAKSEKTPPRVRDEILARGYEAVGDRAKAKEHYLAAVKTAADEDGAAIRLAEFLIRADNPQDARDAETVLLGVRQRSPGNLRVRRLLQGVWLIHGGSEQWQRAAELIEEGEESNDPIDRRLKALSLLRSNRFEDLDKAKAILEELVVDPKKTIPNDHIWLGLVYEALGDPDRADTQYRIVADSPKATPLQLLAYVDFLLRHRPAAAAERWVKQLRTAAPDELATVAAVARWLHAAARDAEIPAVVEPVAEKLQAAAGSNPAGAGAVAQAVGDLYNGVGLRREAERWYRLVREKNPAAIESLAVVLAQQDRLREAIVLCAEASKRDASAAPFVTLTHALASGKPTFKDFDAGLKIVEETVQRNPNNIELLYGLAHLRIFQGRPAEAVELYRRILALQPKQLATLNNLASLLADQEETLAEAMQCIEKALEIAQWPLFWDTKGVVLLQQGRNKEAVDILRQAVNVGRDPRSRLHLAVGYSRLGRTAQAREEFRAFQKAELGRQLLTSVEKRWLSELDAQFPKTGN